MNIAILSRGPELYSTQSLFRSGAQRGHRMHIIDHTRCNLLLNGRRPHVYYDNLHIKHIDAIIPRIGLSVTQQGAAVINHFEIMGAVTCTASQALLQTRDKLRCLQQLNHMGIDSPRTVLVGEEQDPTQLVRAVGGLPVVIKVLQGTHGVGVLLAETLHGVESIIQTFQRLRERIVIQEFIAEANGSDIRAFVVAGEVVAVMKRQAKKGDFRSNLHQGAVATIDRLSSEEEEIVLKTTETMGLGVAGVDLLRSRRGPLIMEVNASPGLEGIETTTGIDVAGKIIGWVEHQALLKRLEASTMY